MAHYLDAPIYVYAYMRSSRLVTPRGALESLSTFRKKTRVYVERKRGRGRGFVYGNTSSGSRERCVELNFEGFGREGGMRVVSRDDFRGDCALRLSPYFSEPL